MRIDAQILKSLALTALVSATALHSAKAWEAEEVAARYKKLTYDKGNEFVWSSVRRDGASIVLEGASLALPSGRIAKIYDELVLKDVSETDSFYEIGHISLGNIELPNRSYPQALIGISLNGVVLPKAIEKPPYGGLMQVRQLSFEEARVSKIGEKPLLVIKDAHLNTQLGDDAETLTYDGAAEMVWLNLSKLADDDVSRNFLNENDYGELTGRIDVAGSWNTENGRSLLDHFDTKFDNFGTLSLEFELDGYTADVARKDAYLDRLDRRIGHRAKEERQALEPAMSNLLGQISLHGASIRFSDASLTGKLIAYVAAQQGVKPEDVANQAKAIVPLMAGQYLGPDLTQSLAKAVTTYLDDPRNLTISIAPEEPMPFAVLMGTAMGSPEALAKQVGLQVRANQ
ncbi:DUF945 domain-containing protein [Nitratireductor aquimarinus]|uniref:hypothetical protein n=1 Tax=Nitratireductor aquimarinus TaxID=889300 RepID=UPI003B5BC1EC